MAKNKGKSNRADLSALKATLKNGNIQVVIETMKGSRNKNAYDPEQGAFILKKVLPEGMAFPHDFGFVPSTKAEDGDPLDVIVLMDAPAFAGCVVESRMIGIIEGEQEEKGKKERNDRVLAVAESSHTHSDIKSVDDLNKTLLEELEKFFEHYHARDGVKFRVLAVKGPNAAAKALEKTRR